MITLWTALSPLSLWGCDQPPIFNSIGTVTVHTQTPGGTTKQDLAGEQLEKARLCLYGTEEIQQTEAKDEYLQTIVLIQVIDRFGDRVFELYTDENLKGNKGKYYRNACIWRVIRPT